MPAKPKSSELPRAFLIGGASATHQEGDVAKQCRSLGRQLGDAGMRLVVCSAHKTSANAWAIEGFATSKGNRPHHVMAYRPSDNRRLPHKESISGQWEALIKSSGIKEIAFSDHADANVAEQGLSNAFLLCQVRALREAADVVIAIGGKDVGSSSLLMAIAREDYPIVPIGSLGGVGRSELNRQESWLRERIANRRLIEHLHSVAAFEHIGEIIAAVRSAHVRRVFLSYPWSRANDADFVEAYLRRSSDIDIFRDEVNIETGEPIAQKILDRIDSSDVFLALWCAEYAASPHCYDELHHAAKRKAGRLYVMRLDDTRPVWPSLREGHDWKNLWLEAFPDPRFAAAAPQQRERSRRERMAMSLDDMLSKFNMNKGRKTLR